MQNKTAASYFPCNYCLRRFSEMFSHSLLIRVFSPSGKYLDDIYQILIMSSEGPDLQVLKGLKLNIMCTDSSVKSHMYAKYRREIQQNYRSLLLTFLKTLLNHWTRSGPLVFLFLSSLYTLFHSHVNIQ